MNASNLEYIGVWWLPEDPSIKYNGKLTITPNLDFNLELSGSFRAERQIMELLPFSIIFGVAGGNQFTLVDCISMQTSMGFPGIIHSNYSIFKILKGIHLTNPHEVKLSSFSV